MKRRPPGPTRTYTPFPYRTLLRSCEAMVGRVLRTAADARPDAVLFLSVDDFSAVAEEPTVAHLHAAGRLTPIEARFHIVDSVVEASRITGFPDLKSVVYGKRVS